MLNLIIIIKKVFNTYIIAKQTNKQKTTDAAVDRLLEVRERQRAVYMPPDCACVRLLRAFATSVSPQPRSRRSVRLCASIRLTAMKNLHFKDFFWVSLYSAEFCLILGLIDKKKKKKRRSL